jgi:biopolymer transport protein ExbD
MRRSVITLTPLIDVVFILLVFFMLASSFVDWRVLQVGMALGGVGQGSTGVFLVEVREGDIRLSGVAMNTDGLAQRLRMRPAKSPDTRVLVKPAAGVDLQRAIDIVDVIAGLGVKDVSFVETGGARP